MSKPSAKYVKWVKEAALVAKERRTAIAKTARAGIRSPTRGAVRAKDKAEIAEYLARVPPRSY